MASTLGSFAVAAASGLAFLAYNHHDFYARLAGTISGLTMAVYVAIAIWNMAIQRLSGRLYGDTAGDRKSYDAIEKAQAELTLSFFWSTVICYGLIAYVWLLTLLPRPGQ